MSKFQILIYYCCILIGASGAFLIHLLAGQSFIAAMLIGACVAILCCAIGDALGESKNR